MERALATFDGATPGLAGAAKKTEWRIDHIKVVET